MNRDRLPRTLKCRPKCRARFTRIMWKMITRMRMKKPASNNKIKILKIMPVIGLAKISRTHRLHLDSERKDRLVKGIHSNILRILNNLDSFLKEIITIIIITITIRILKSSARIRTKLQIIWRMKSNYNKIMQLQQEDNSNRINNNNIIKNDNFSSNNLMLEGTRQKSCQSKRDKDYQNYGKKETLLISILGCK